MIVNINGTSTLIPIHEFQTYKNVEQNVANDTNKNGMKDFQKKQRKKDTRLQ